MQDSNFQSIEVTYSFVRVENEISTPCIYIRLRPENPNNLRTEVKEFNVILDYENDDLYGIEIIGKVPLARLLEYIPEEYKIVIEKIFKEICSFLE